MTTGIGDDGAVRPLPDPSLPPRALHGGRVDDIDPVTGLPNRRGLLAAIASLDEACRRHGAEAAVLVLEVAPAGNPADEAEPVHHDPDQLRLLTTRLLKAVAGVDDVVARTGPDQFTAILPGADASCAEALCMSLAEKLATHGIEAAVGCVLASRSGGLRPAWEAADAEMQRVRSRRLSTAPARHLAVAPAAG